MEVLSCPKSRHVTWKSFSRLLAPTGPNVIGANTLNFGENFEFLLLKIVGRPSLRWDVHYKTL